MKIGTRKISYIITLISIISVMLTSGITEGKATKLSISPLSLDRTMMPGEEYTTKITVSNEENTSEILIPRINDFYVDENGEIAEIAESETSNDPEIAKYSLKKWITIENQKAENFAPKQEREYKIKITVPKDATPGGHYGVVAFNQTTPEEAGKVQTEIGGQIGGAGAIGSLILITIPGEYSKAGGSSNFRAGKFYNENKFTNKVLFSDQGVFEKTKMAFAFEFKNGGKTHYRPKGFITIKSFFGNKIDEIQIQEARVFPGLQRTIYTDYEHGFLPGIYQADLTVVDGDGMNTSLSTKFIILPLKVIFIALGMLLLIIITAHLYGKHIENKYKKYGIKLEK